MSWLPPTKTINDVAVYVKRQFGDESGVQITDDDIIRWVNAAQAEISNNNNILKASANLVLTVDVYTYPLGVDMNIESIQSIHVAGIKIDYMNFNDFETYITNEDPNRTQRGKPLYWSEWAGSIFLYPMPDSAYTMQVFYNAAPATLVTATDTLILPDKYFQRIIDYVMAQAFELDENFNAATAKMDFLDSKLVSMSNDEVKGAVATYPRITVLPEDLY
jgi:hypothetical protein